MRNLMFLLCMVLFLSCQDKYLCECIDNDQVDLFNGDIDGLRIQTANVVPIHMDFFVVLVDNAANRWDGISIKLFDNDRVYLDTNDGVDYMKDFGGSLLLEVPISSIMHNGEYVLGEVKYAIGLYLEGDIVQLRGSISVISCDHCYEDFDREGCRWSCRILRRLTPSGPLCASECPF